eukprot:Protomagalhaensia_sp_Gyna_25__922@NODE_1444_length_1831_cov_375_118304_g1168_i0_p1_GENE_NODE_1444_length_1831_cov_375_118304_g1168_i0NODE_1444_length_1831_cov_375_118304_g1168_i0_p1_ORF_typecomplete_len433_score46_63_NODE_1444_length_1831_cov_375_118304_g1168_i01311429
MLRSLFRWFILFYGNCISLFYVSGILYVSAFESISNPHDKLQCKPAWDLPLVYTNATQQVLDYNFEYGLFNYTSPTTAHPLRLEQDFMPQRHQQLLLNCASAVAVGRQSCDGRLRPACDAYCEAQCQLHCSYPASAQALADCLNSYAMDGCYYRVDHTLELKARAACRKVFSNEIKAFPYINGNDVGSTTVTPSNTETTSLPPPSTIDSTDTSAADETSTVGGTTTSIADVGVIPGIELTDVTIYVIEIDDRGLREVNWKRLLKAALIMGLERDFDLDPLAPEYGNLIDLTSNVTIESCNVPYNHIIYSPLDRPDRLVYSTKLGSSYYVANTTNIVSHITPILTSSATSHTTSPSLQLQVWWPGTQPKFSNAANFTEEGISLKVTFQGYPSHYMSTQGFTLLPSSSQRYIQVHLWRLGIWVLLALEIMSQWI